MRSPRAIAPITARPANNYSQALAVKISTKLALSVGYNIQDNTKPPANLKKLDTLEINPAYSF
jgi:putative salt-induced outer membrane protein YdiY